MVFDPKRKFTITQKKLHQNVDYTPWEGFEMTGMPEIVYSRGKRVAEWSGDQMKFVGELGGAGSSRGNRSPRSETGASHPLGGDALLRQSRRNAHGHIEAEGQRGAAARQPGGNGEDRRHARGGVQRLALSDEDRRARDLFVKWLKEIDLA